MMNNVIVLDFSSKYYTDVHQLSNIFSAKTGQYLGDKWKLNDITQYQINNDGIFTNIRQLKTMDILNGEDAKNAFIHHDYDTCLAELWSVKTIAWRFKWAKRLLLLVISWIKSK